MKNKRLLSVLAISIIVMLLASATSLAQITITNATFPAAGDTLKMAIDNSPDAGIVIITPPGGNQIWDLSGLQVDATQNIVYHSASQGSIQVPGAELFAVTSPNLEEYYNVNSNSFELLADYGNHYDVIGNSLFNYFPQITERRAPLNFFDINAISSIILESFPTSVFPPALIAALPVTVDSLRYRIRINRVDVVDGWGSLSIPGGTYNVLREKRSLYRESHLDAKVPPLGWLDITDVAIQAGFHNLGIDTTISYYFHNNVEKEPIAIVTLNNEQNAATQVIFKNNNNPTVPVELLSFIASISDNNIVLDWQTATELNNYGFEIQRQDEDDNWETLAFVNGNGNSTTPKSYSYTDNYPTGETKIRYRLKQIDFNGQYKYSGEVEVSYVPKEFALYQNYPNPFNPTTKIKYTLPVESNVTIEVFDILGNRVKTLIQEKQEAGTNEVEFNAGNLVSGVYFYQIQAGTFTQTKKMILMK
jgi:hypothetical protein